MTGARRIAAAVALAGRATPLLVAGKGHETGQEVAGTVRPFDDRAVLREVLGRRREAPRMIALTLAEVAELTGGELTGDRPGRVVTGAVTLDSRAVAAGDLFVAVAGGAGRRRTTSCPPPRRPAPSPRSPPAPDDALPCVVVADPVDALGRLAAGVHAPAGRRRPADGRRSPAPRARPRPRTCSARCWPPPARR